jgi:hypothetical protein
VPERIDINASLLKFRKDRQQGVRQNPDIVPNLWKQHRQQSAFEKAKRTVGHGNDGTGSGYIAKITGVHFVSSSKEKASGLPAPPDG